MEKQEKWRREKGGTNARAVEIKMWSSKSKEKERKGWKDVLKSGMKNGVKDEKGVKSVRRIVLSGMESAHC